MFNYKRTVILTIWFWGLVTKCQSGPKSEIKIGIYININRYKKRAYMKTVLKVTRCWFGCVQEVIWLYDHVLYPKTILWNVLHWSLFGKNRPATSSRKIQSKFLPEKSRQTDLQTLSLWLKFSCLAFFWKHSTFWCCKYWSGLAFYCHQNAVCWL